VLVELRLQQQTVIAVMKLFMEWLLQVVVLVVLELLTQLLQLLVAVVVVEQEQQQRQTFKPPHQEFLILERHLLQ
jgi:hypothetical protein